MDSNIQRIIDNIERIAPQAFEEVVRYHQTAAVMDCTVLVLLLVGSLWGIRCAWKMPTNTYDETKGVLLIVFSIIAAAWILLLAHFVSVAINPEGYVISQIFTSSR